MAARKPFMSIDIYKRQRLMFHASKSALRGFTSFLLLSQIHNLLLAFPLGYYADDSEPYAGSNTKLARAVLCYAILSIHQSRAFHPHPRKTHPHPNPIQPPNRSPPTNLDRKRKPIHARPIQLHRRVPHSRPRAHLVGERGAQFHAHGAGSRCFFDGEPELVGVAGGVEGAD